jgi:hypothetical protein
VSFNETGHRPIFSVDAPSLFSSFTYLAVVVEHVVVPEHGVLDDDPVLLAVPDDEGRLSALARHCQVHGDGPAVHVVVERAVLEGDLELFVDLSGVKVVEKNRSNDLSIFLDNNKRRKVRARARGCVREASHDARFRTTGQPQVQMDDEAHVLGSGNL